MRFITDKFYKINNMNQVSFMARPDFTHQEIVRNILINYFLETDFKFDCFQESVIDKNDLDSFSPDLCFFERKNPYPSVIIEIDHVQSYKAHTDSKMPAYFTKYTEVKEIFVYLYDLKEWRLYTEYKNFKETSYSKVLDIDLNDLIERPKYPFVGKP